MAKVLVSLVIIILMIFISIFYKPIFIKSNDSLASKGVELIPNAQNKVKVLIQKIAISPNDQVFKAVGTARARQSADLYPSVADKVIAVYFKAEQQVNKGDILVQLDDREEQLKLSLAKVQASNAETLLRRYDSAYKEGTVPVTDYDAALTALEAANVAISQSKLAIEERKIIAPFNGVVGIPNVNPGDRATQTTLITGLDDRRTLYVEFEVPESLAGILQHAEQQHREIIASTPAYPNKIFKGSITAQESRIDPMHRTLRARATIDNKEDLLKPGMSFETIWNIPGKSYPTIQEIAVQWEQQGSFIWVVRDNIAHKIKVNVIARKAGLVLIEGEISENERVVVEGLQRLRPNIAVEILGEIKNEYY